MYRLRFIRIMILCFFTKHKGQLNEKFYLNFWAVPFFDTDVTRLFTQSYNVMASLGRWHYLFSSVFKNIAVKNHWLPVTTIEKVIFKKSIRMFDRVLLETEIIYWDEQRFYLRQNFWVKNQIYAVGYTQGLIRGPEGHLNPIKVFEAMNLKFEKRSVPAEVQSLIS